MRLPLLELGSTIQLRSMTSLEIAKLRLDEWKFRQTHCWKVLQTCMLAGVSVSIAPYLVKPAKLAPLGDLLLLFPIVGGIIALLGVWVFAAEYVRSQESLHSYRSVLESPRAAKEREQERPWLFRRRIGWVTVWCLGAGSSVLLLLNVYATKVIFLP
jgi:hypothetical protein